MKNYSTKLILLPTSCFRVVTTVVLAAVVSACSATGDVDTDRLSTLLTGAAQNTTASCDLSDNQLQSSMVAAVNASRQSAQQCGADMLPAAGPVQWNTRLAAAARNHAADMAAVNFFNHTGSDGLDVSDRVEATGYQWRAVGENIAAGQTDVGEAHQEWLDSPGHCRNIMNRDYSEIGAACVDDDQTNYGSYWVVVFGDQL